ncbi:FecR domain-containing protein [Colwellia sp. 1_MG-2023]|uniref:FecR family protein n=1 Tax=unclassified Colwellia TaxID=196834 RepID=UPI001C0A4CF8|nr:MULTISPECIES: FecR domain-containing protein [unclassified Colwellia]MBU2926289.1 FecR domain-containing protein [Colwellia sp. C2M11]MDO6651727.1 FecR domain-containing protein [Colwellia sp. 3_MG-2023]MDO6665362.1 FecR domain-containing protein [Colwellia sp. 2_MG-2023]MDO6689735.1 FecR domain-containing protein [Colwellia sp. 1_MG-2023]
MKNIIEFPDREIIDEEALVWLVRLDSDKPLSEQEELALEEWLARSPVHREALKSLNAFWTHCNVLGKLAKPKSITQLCRNRLLSYIEHSIRYKAQIMAMIVVLSVVFSYWFSYQNITNSNGLYSTAVGQQEMIMLADGSRVQLNTNSQIQVNYSDEFRDIRLLQGEVHFEVAKDKQKPFRVYAGNGRVQAVGTAFNVYINKGDVDVLVTEGSVELASILPISLNLSQSNKQNDLSYDDLNQAPPTIGRPAKRMSDSNRDNASAVNGLGVVTAGEGVTMKKLDTVSSSDVNDLSNKKPLIKLVPIGENDKKRKQLAWRKGLLIFSGESLEEVIEEISRYIPVSIEIVNPELRHIQIGGQIKVGDTDSMFKALEANLGLKIKHLNYNHVQVVSAPEEF